MDIWTDEFEDFEISNREVGRTSLLVGTVSILGWLVWISGVGYKRGHPPPILISTFLPSFPPSHRQHSRFLPTTRSPSQVVLPSLTVISLFPQWSSPYHPSSVMHPFPAVVLCALALLAVVTAAPHPQYYDTGDSYGTEDCSTSSSYYYYPPAYTTSSCDDVVPTTSSCSDDSYPTTSSCEDEISTSTYYAYPPPLWTTSTPCESPTYVSPPDTICTTSETYYTPPSYPDTSCSSSEIYYPPTTTSCESDTYYTPLSYPDTSCSDSDTYTPPSYPDTSCSTSQGYYTTTPCESDTYYTPPSYPTTSCDSDTYFSPPSYPTTTPCESDTSYTPYTTPCESDTYYSPPSYPDTSCSSSDTSPTTSCETDTYYSPPSYTTPCQSDTDYTPPSYADTSCSSSEVYPTTPCESDTYSPPSYPTTSCESDTYYSPTYPDTSCSSTEVYPTTSCDTESSSTSSYYYPDTTPAYVYPTYTTSSYYYQETPTYTTSTAYVYTTTSEEYSSSYPTPTYTSPAGGGYHSKINSYLIKAESSCLTGYTEEYSYLIWTPAESDTGFTSYSFVSIGYSIYAPNAHAALVYSESGCLDQGTASLGEYYKAYPNHSPPPESEAEYLFIVPDTFCPVGLDSSIPSGAGYQSFGVDSNGYLTYGGQQSWALCTPQSGDYTSNSLYLYWMGDSSCPDYCYPATLSLVYYGFPGPEDHYYENTGGDCGASSSMCTTSEYGTPTYTPPYYTTPSDTPPSYPTYTTTYGEESYPTDTYGSPTYTYPTPYGGETSSSPYDTPSWNGYGSPTTLATVYREMN